MSRIPQGGGRTVIDYTGRDYDALLQAMVAQVPSRLPEWTQSSNEADFGRVLLELFAYMGDNLSYYLDRVANESFLGTAQTRRAVIEHLRLIGYRLGTAAPAAATLSVTVPATCNDTLTVKKGDSFITGSYRNRPAVRFEYTGEQDWLINFKDGPGVRVQGSKKIYGGVCDPQTKPPVGIPVEEGRFVWDEVLGVSDATPNQRFALARPGLILRAPEMAQATNPDIGLTVKLPGAPDDNGWMLRETLAFSGADDPHFTVDIDDGDGAVLIFGDGVYGRIPPNGATLLATYRVGGGAAGNVDAGTIKAILNAGDLTKYGATVNNPCPAKGGAERESIEQAVAHAPAVFRSLKRAVTIADYEALASSFPGVARAKARATGWNVVTLTIVPEGGGQVSDVLESNLRAYFEDKRMAGQIIEVEGPGYVPVSVSIEIASERFANAVAVLANVQVACARLLSFANVNLGQSIYLSDFYKVAEETEGVLYANITAFCRGDSCAQIPASGKIEFSPYELPVGTDKGGFQGGVRVIRVGEGA